jgi:hypothetical protein
MNNVVLHTEYVDALTRLVKERNAETRKLILDRFATLAQTAKGNPYLFQRLVSADRKNLMRKLIQRALARRKTAQQLGKKFGQERKKKPDAVASIPT